MSSSLEYVRNGCGMAGEEVADEFDKMELKLAGLQSSVDSLVDSNLYQAKLIQAQHKLLIESGVSCGSKEILAGMRYVESLKQQRDELLAAASVYASNYLVDEYDSAEHCIDKDQHDAVVRLFKAIAKAGA